MLHRQSNGIRNSTHSSSLLQNGSRGTVTERKESVSTSQPSAQRGRLRFLLAFLNAYQQGKQP